MVINSKTPIQLAKLLVGEGSVNAPAYVAFGTGTTAATRSDTQLQTEQERKDNEGGSGSGIAYARGTLTSVDTAETYTEVGVLDAASNGNLWHRHVHGNHTHDGDKDTRVTVIIPFVPVNSSKSQITNTLVSAVASFVGAGTTFTVPTHVAWGTRIIGDDCDAITGWVSSTDATTEVLNTSNFQEGTGSLDLGKSGTSSAIFSYSKTITSRDLTGFTKFRVWTNILNSVDLNNLASSGALKLRFGSDSSNYKEISLDRADLIVGWQEIETTIADMSDTGSPNISAIDFLEVVFTTSSSAITIASGNVLLDYVSFTRDIDWDDTELFDEQYIQILDSASRIAGDSLAKFKVQVGKSDGNTFTYNYAGLFNSSSGGDLHFQSSFIDAPKDDKTKILQDININFSIGDT